MTEASADDLDIVAHILPQTRTWFFTILQGQTKSRVQHHSPASFKQPTHIVSSRPGSVRSPRQIRGVGAASAGFSDVNYLTLERVKDDDKFAAYLKTFIKRISAVSCALRDDAHQLEVKP